MLALEKVKRSSSFQILSEKWRRHLFPETGFQYILFVLCVNSPHVGNLSGLAVIQIQSVHDSKDDDLQTPYCISSLHQQCCSVNSRCQIWPIRVLAVVYQILVYRHKLFKINFTEVLLPLFPASPHFFFLTPDFLLRPTNWMPDWFTGWSIYWMIDLPTYWFTLYWFI